MTGWVPPDFSVPENSQIGISPPGIQRSRSQDLKSAIKTYKKYVYTKVNTFSNLGGGPPWALFRLLPVPGQYGKVWTIPRPGAKKHVFAFLLRPRPIGPGPIWARAHLGPGPFGPGPIWARACLGPGPFGPGPVWPGPISLSGPIPKIVYMAYAYPYPYAHPYPYSYANCL